MPISRVVAMRSFILAFSGMTWLVGPSLAAVVPPDLPAGSQYKVIFVTADSTTALSTDIGYYNSFVAAEAPSIDGASWMAVVTTPYVATLPDASTEPIYNTQGQLVADNVMDLWNGNLHNAISYDQYGERPGKYEVWTGCEWPYPQYTYPLGVYSTYGSTNISPNMGCANFANNQWLDYENYDVSSNPLEMLFPLYGISSPITVVPEPSALVLLGIGAISLLAFARRRRSRTT
jgi:hypothetical protein